MAEQRTLTPSVVVRVHVPQSQEEEPLDMPVERFFAMLRFEQRDKLAELPVDWSDKALVNDASPFTK